MQAGAIRHLFSTICALSKAKGMYFVMQNIKIMKTISNIHIADVWAYLLSEKHLSNSLRDVISVAYDKYQNNRRWEANFNGSIIRWIEEIYCVPEKEIHFRHINGIFSEYYGNVYLYTDANNSVVVFINIHFDVGIAGLSDVLDVIILSAINNNINDYFDYIETIKISN